MNTPLPYFTVEIKLFAAVKQAVGQATVEIELPDQADVIALRNRLTEAFPELASLLPHCRFAIDTAYVAESTRISEGDEIACIPPVSGG